MKIINTVVKELVSCLRLQYGVEEVYGIRNGYMGFYSAPWASAASCIQRCHGGCVPLDCRYLGTRDYSHIVSQYGSCESWYALVPNMFGRLRMCASLGGDHPDTLTSINNLGSLLQAKGDLDGAEVLTREALQAQRETRAEERRGGPEWRSRWRP